MTENRNNKGIVLFIILITLLIVVVLANIIIALMSSQSRLTHHQISRIQSYYANYGAMNYAFDKIRRVDPLWPKPDPGTSYFRTFCTTAGPGCDVVEPDMPRAITNLRVTVSSRGVNNCNPPGDVPYCLTCTATYTYTP